MKIFKILVLHILLGGTLVAQPFSSEMIFRISAPDSIHIEWGDLSGDGLLDAVTFMQSDGKTTAFSLVQLDSVTFEKKELKVDAMAQLNFQLKDFNHDGRLDIIYISKRENQALIIALNTGQLGFESIELNFYINEFLINDIDHDGDEDIIASNSIGLGETSIYWIKNDTAFIKMNQLPEVGLIHGKYFIENQILHTEIETERSICQLAPFILEDDSLILIPISDLPQIIALDHGDLNHDGRIDLVLQSNDHYFILSADQEQFIQDTLASNIMGIDEIFVGDFDLDGLADILTTNTEKSDGRSILYKNDGLGNFTSDSTFFSLNNGFKNTPADINDDGDMDLLSLVAKNDSIYFNVQLNQTTILNKGPEPVLILPPLTVYDETYLSWQLTTDDHTDTMAISYELFIQNGASRKYLTMPGYDMDSSTRDGFRKIVGHGYQWFDSYYTATSLENGRYYWGVVGVDNAYYASADIRDCEGRDEPCIDFYTVFNCFDLIVEDTTLCFNSNITIDLGRGNDSISWYSVRQGFMEKSPVLNFQALESDTIYALHYPKIPCNEETDLCVLNYSLAIRVEKREEELLDEAMICPSKESIISVDGSWDSIRWWYDDVIISRRPKIKIDSIPEIPVVVEVFDSLTCSIYDTLQLMEVERNFDAGSFSEKIIACLGQATEVRIFESIDVENLQFSWRPPDIFDDPSLPNPLITATQVTEVSVIVTEDDCYVDTLLFDLEIDLLPVVTTNGNQEIFRSEKVLLEASGANSYSWTPDNGLQSPNAQQTWAEPTITSSYSVRGTNEQGCYADAALRVLVKNSVYIPDLFSPNGDGYNDFLHVYGEEIHQISFKVFDERGSLMVEIDEASNSTGWDGTILGNELPSGTYFWTVNGAFTDGQAISFLGKDKGTIRLVR